MATLIKMSRTTFLLLLLATAGTPLSAQPVLEQMRPSGGQRGSAARLILEGVSLDAKPRLVTSVPAAITPLSQQKSTDEALSYLIEIAADAPFGRYPVRIQTTEGLSNVLLFDVGPYPETEESESGTLAEEFSNDSRQQAETVSLPVTVQGRLAGPDRDYYSFHAAKGQSLVFEVDAERSGSAVDPFIEVFDGAGQRLARNGDAPGLGRDARVAVKFAADGNYFVAVNDQRFSEQKADFYRLTIADYNYADGVFPLGWRRGETVEAEFFGGNLATPRRSEISLDHVPSTADEMLVSVPDSHSSLPFVVGDEPEVLESPGTGPKELPQDTIVNGRLAMKGEVDRYRLSVEAGEKWAFELQSGELDGSDLYGVLAISATNNDKNEVIARAGTYQGDPSPYVISNTGETSSHPFINLEVPPGVGELEVSVEDLLQRGGPSFSYRLVARKQPPDFLLTLNAPFVNIPLRGSAVVTVTAERRGFSGSIDLSVPNAPSDLIVQGGYIPATSGLESTRPRFSTGTITLTPKPGAEIGPLELSVVGRAVLEDGMKIERRAQGPGLIVDVSGKGQKAIRAEWLGYELPAMITPAEPAVLEIVTPRKFRLVLGGKPHLARWEFTTRGGGASLAEPIEVPRGAGTVRLRGDEENSGPKKGEFSIFAHERTPVGRTEFSLNAMIRSGDRKRTIYSQPFEINVVEGYSMQAPENELTLSQGGSGEWAGSIHRDAEFIQPVTVKAGNLPVGVTCEEAQVGTERTGFEIRCQAAPAAAAGEYEVEILASSKLSEDATTPYNLPAASVKLVVKASTQAANRGPSRR